MIRQAKFEDIPRVLELLEAAKERSIFATFGNFDERFARGVVEEMGARQTSPGDQRTFFWVAQKSGRVQGFLIGFRQRIYQISDRYEGTDLFTLINEREGDAADFVKLITKFKEWARAAEGTLQLTTGLNDILGPNWKRLVPVYEGLGFQQTGVIMTARFQK